MGVNTLDRSVITVAWVALGVWTALCFVGIFIAAEVVDILLFALGTFTGIGLYVYGTHFGVWQYTYFVRSTPLEEDERDE